mmetsp:Transcript_50433/g.118691  ORF Transcript_50433/g.118691 Transcript_50433/m.118691 type:complete len:292 (-) Transcript_50433:221-1096(-)
MSGARGSRSALSFADDNNPRTDRQMIASPVSSKGSFGRRSAPTPVEEGVAWDSTGRMPGNLLKQNFEMRHVAPAGLLLSRQVSPFGIGSHAFGTDYGQLGTTRPEQDKLKRMYHYEPPSPESPVSSIASSRIWGPARDPLPSLRQYAPEGPVRPNGDEDNEWPTWHRLPEESKYRWPISRDRYSPVQQVKPASEGSERGAKYLTARRLLMQAGGTPPAPRSPALSRVSSPAGERKAPRSPERPRDPRDRDEIKPPPSSAGGFPSWSRIRQDFKHDWCVARNRYDLDRFPKK